MSIVCSICGETHVKCAAVVDPNTKEFIEFGHEALQDGECPNCGNVLLTCPDKVKSDIDKAWANYISNHQQAPNYAACEIVRTGDYNGPEMYDIRIGGPENAVERHKVLAVSRDLEELKALAVPDPEREFTLTELLNLEFRKILENKTYEMEFEGKKIPVTTAEVLAFYPEQHCLTEKEIEEYAAAYTARIKYYRTCERMLDKALIRRLLKEEGLMKTGESDGFKLPFLGFQWYAELRKEEMIYHPYRYSINAYCLDNAQTFSRRYLTMRDALLHCLNGFNENSSILNRYQSVEVFLNDTTIK